MIKLLKSRSKRKRKDTVTRDTVSIDISRVVPGFTPAGEQTETPPPATAPEAPATVTPSLAATTQTEQDTTPPLEQKYEGWLRRDMLRLTTGWTALREDMSDQTHFKQLRLAVHDLKGMASSYGYPVISKLAHSLDALLKTQIWNQNEQLISLHIDACRAAANDTPTSDEEIDTVSNAVCDALYAQVTQLTADTALAEVSVKAG